MSKMVVEQDHVIVMEAFRWMVFVCLLGSFLNWLLVKTTGFYFRLVVGFLADCSVCCVYSVCYFSSSHNAYLAFSLPIFDFEKRQKGINRIELFHNVPYCVKDRGSVSIFLASLNKRSWKSEMSVIKLTKNDRHYKPWERLKPKGRNVGNVRNHLFSLISDRENHPKDKSCDRVPTCWEQSSVIPPIMSVLDISYHRNMRWNPESSAGRDVSRVP